MNKVILSQSGKRLIFPRNTKDILVDTNVFLSFMYPSRAYHDDARHFILSAAAEKVNLFYNVSTFQELLHYNNKEFLKNKAIELGINIGEPQYTQNYGYKALVTELNKRDSNSRHEALEQSNIFTRTTLSVADILEDAHDNDHIKKIELLNHKYGGLLEPADLSLLKTCIDYGINTVATADFQYTQVPNINILALPTSDFRSYAATTNSSTTYTAKSFTTGLMIE